MVRQVWVRRRGGEISTLPGKRPILDLMLVLALISSASMWFYVGSILKPQQVADAAAHDRPRGNLSDLYPRWLGARELLLHGRDPYGSEITREIQGGYYGRPLDPTRPNDPKDQQAFAYPVYVVFLLSPAVTLPFAIVQKAFLGILIALTFVSVPLWLRVIGWSASIPEQLIWIPLALGCFPAVQGFKLQQLTLLVTTLLAASMMAVVRRHFAWAGILLAVASIKPQLLFLLVVWLLIWVLGNWRERQTLLWSFISSMAVLLIGSELVLPGWIREFRAATVAYYQYTGGGRSILDVFLTPLWGRTLSGVLVAFTVALLWRVRNSSEHSAQFQWSIGLVLAVTLLVVPTFAPYNQLLLLPGVMLVVRSMTKLWERNLASRSLVVFAAISIIWPWIAALALLSALAFLPPVTVQKAWALPLYTSNVIPIFITALLLLDRNVLSERRDAGKGSE